MRLASGQEALVTRVLTKEAKAFFGFSLQLDATESRHMALFHAGLRGARPRIAPVLGHPWEAAGVSGSPIPWGFEAGFARLRWLP
ncbi:MAG: hypothetical protein ACREUN_10020 [Burkholderiales bacterium]